MLLCLFYWRYVCVFLGRGQCQHWNWNSGVGKWQKWLPEVYNFFLSFLANNRHEKSDVEMSTSVNPLALYPGWNATYCCFYFLLLSIQVWIVNNIILVWKILFLHGLPFSLISAVFDSCRCSERCKESIINLSYFLKKLFSKLIIFYFKTCLCFYAKNRSSCKPPFSALIFCA